LASALLFAQSSWAESKAPEVTNVAVGAGANEMGTVEVQLTGVPTYSARLDQEAKRLIIDLNDAQINGAPAALDRPHGVVGGVMTQTFKQEGRTVTRVSISLLKEARYGISVDGNSLRVRFEKGTFGAISARDPSLSTKVSATRSETSITDIRFEHKSSRDIVEIELDARAHFRVENSPGGVSRLSLRNARLPQALARKLDVAGYGGAVHAVASFNQGGEVVIEATRDPGLTSSVERRGNVWGWSF
jgi:type IV pilus assembly protein PilQ